MIIQTIIDENSYDLSEPGCRVVARAINTDFVKMYDLDDNNELWAYLADDPQELGETGRCIAQFDDRESALEFIKMISRLDIHTVITTYIKR